MTSVDISHPALPERPEFRSRFDLALRSVAGWSSGDRHLFVASFTTTKSAAQIADELGISQQNVHSQRRELLRRFMRAASPLAAA